MGRGGVIVSVDGFFAAFAGVAQLVERVICNHEVAGSIPAAGTMVFKDLDEFSESVFLKYAVGLT